MRFRSGKMPRRLPTVQRSSTMHIDVQLCPKWSLGSWVVVLSIDTSRIGSVPYLEDAGPAVTPRPTSTQGLQRLRALYNCTQADIGVPVFSATARTENVWPRYLEGPRCGECHRCSRLCSAPVDVLWAGLLVDKVSEQQSFHLELRRYHREAGDGLESEHDAPQSLLSSPPQVPLSRVVSLRDSCGCKVLQDGQNVEAG